MKQVAKILMALCCVCLLQTQYCFSQTEETKEKQLGPFSIGANKKVFFSPGSLQYNAALGTHQCADGTTKQGTWRFAEHQWDMVGMGYGQTDETNFNYIGGTILNSDNRLVSSTYNGWIDLFGWGTSGWNSGAKAYEPWSTSTDYADYYPGNSSSNNLTGEYAYADWGVYNQVGNDAPETWRTLTYDEWDYLLQTRTDASLKYGAAKVNGMGGLVILPDEWSLPEGCAFTPGMAGSNDLKWNSVASTNIYTASRWQLMEAAGAVFLPAAGYRNRTAIYDAGADGYYWSATQCGLKESYRIRFYSGDLYPKYDGSRYYGRSVRLVKDTVLSLSAYQPMPFSVADGMTVLFSSGNLQYNAALGTHQCADGTTQQGIWRFADNQWDIVGKGLGLVDNNNPHNTVGGNVTNADNRKAADNYNGWIDLFGWGTSGWNSGANEYQPWSTSESYADYYPGNNPANNLTGEYAYADWGIYNQIGDDPPASWRTLTKDEWVYLIKKRPNAKSKWGNAKVNGVTGLVLLPDEWSLPEGLAFTAGLISAEEWYDWSGLVATNIYTLPQWRKMEAAGAVFLPCAGYRYGQLSIYRTGTYGNYWSSTPRNSSTPYTMRFYSNTIYPDGNIGHNYGVSVRLVAEVIQPDQTIEETVLPDEHLCDGDTFLWLDGEYYTASQTLTYTDKSRKTGRDSVIIQSIVFHPVYTMPTEQASVRQGLAYRWQDNDYSEEGYYEKRLKTVYGCDSVLSLQLNVLHHIYTDFSAATCDNEPYYWDGMAYTEAGEYTRTYEAANGADSIVTLTLLVTPTYNTELTDTILYGTTYSWLNKSLSEEGDYEEHLP